MGWKPRSGVWSTPTSSASSSGALTVESLMPTKPFYASWDTAATISCPFDSAGRNGRGRKGSTATNASGFRGSKRPEASNLSGGGPSGSGEVEAALVIQRDLTQYMQASEALRAAQAELAHANRVATMGQLTASIAHEVNQPIAATLTNAQAALRCLTRPAPELGEVREALASIVKDAVRAGDVVSRIRDLLNKAPPRKDLLDVNGVVCEVIELTHGEAVKNGVFLLTELADSMPLIPGDRIQLQQVMLNLIINAVEAMSGVGNGARELLISTGKTASGDVLVAARDSGPGLALAALERVFDPFYTSKPGGLGMGLSICPSIIEP